MNSYTHVTYALLLVGLLLGGGCRVDSEASRVGSTGSIGHEREASDHRASDPTASAAVQDWNAVRDAEKLRLLKDFYVTEGWGLEEFSFIALTEIYAPGSALMASEYRKINGELVISYRVRMCDRSIEWFTIDDEGRLLSGVPPPD